MTIGLLQEPAPETRVSLLPEHIGFLLKKGFKVLVQTDAGKRAYAINEAYQAVGAKVLSRHEVVSQSDIILNMHAQLIRDWKDKIFIGQYQPNNRIADMQKLAAQNCTVFSLDLVPHTIRSQAVDVRINQGKLAGYKAVLMAAQMLPRFFPLFSTIEREIKPATVLIIGAGVVGLQAVTTAKKLGAMVQVYDNRLAVKDEVQRLGAKFLPSALHQGPMMPPGSFNSQTETELQLIRDEIMEAIVGADVVITSASVQGQKAPVLITKAMIHEMKPGSVIMDLTAESGGNTEVTEKNVTVTYHFVTVVGETNLPASTPIDASRLYGDNILNFLGLITQPNGTIHLNFSDDLVSSACVCHGGKIVHPALESLMVEV